MSSSDQPGVRLTVTTADPATEIFVLDARFHLATRGIGRLDEDLPPGLYVVRARSGPETREEVVLLPRGSSEPVSASFDAINFGSPAPLADTGKTHESHIALAREVSRTVQVNAGSGSWIFVCSRDWSNQAGTAPNQPARSPMQGLSLRTLDGGTNIDLDANAVKLLDIPDPCAACTIQVDPGAYRLVLEATPGLTVEQTVVASPGWQTQVFLLQHDYAPEPEWRRADVVGASILMANGPGFEENREEQRLAEMARLALRDGRRVLSSDLRVMLHEKFSDPMLGLFGAHLLLREQSIDEALYQIVVGNLQALLGQHPDVQALSLARREAVDPPSFTAPPMLRESWELILDVTVTRPEIVPPDSLLAGIAPRIWGEGPWLIWMERSEDDLVNDLAQIATSMAVQFGGVIEQPSATSRSTAGPADSFADGALGGLESTVEGAGDSSETIFRGGVSFGMSGDEAETGDPDTPAVAFDEATVSRLVRSLGVPRLTIEKMIGRS